MKSIAFIAKKGHAETAALCRDIVRAHPERQFLAQGDLADELGWPRISDAELASQAELVIVLGGDGTLIYAARVLAGKPVPILGINLGSLGFLTEVPKANLYPVLEKVLAGEFSTDVRMKLSVRLTRRGKVIVEDEVLNDVVINKGALARIADLETFIDGHQITTYKSDGVIVATPTGSTAYSLSTGGPICHPRIQGMVISPICPHALTQRPIVIPADQVIKIVLKSAVADMYLTLDGQSGHALESEDEIEVRRSANSVVLIRNPDIHYYGVLREKLHWGHR